MLHLVDRCITCERPLWQRTIGRLLRNERSGKSVGEVAFVVRTKGPGQGRAWKFERALPGVPDVLAFAGQGAVDQLRALAIRGFARSWALGLSTWSDVQAVVSQVSQAPPATVPVHHATYGAPAVQTAPAALRPAPVPQTAPPPPRPPPPPPPLPPVAPATDPAPPVPVNVTRFKP